MKNIQWLDKDEYPFKSNWYFIEQAGNLHYIDEGEGQPIIFVHGTPEWSFIFRNVVKKFSGHYRCIALDYIGFGLSDKPLNWTYTPKAHAENLEKLIAHLGLKNIILVVHDFGGPIGLSYAINHPENVQKIILSNTWMWSLKDDKHFSQAGKILGGSLGKWLYKYFNFSPNVMMRIATYNKKAFNKAIHKHYTSPFPTPNSRIATWRLAQELIGSSDWYNMLWQQVEKIKNIPALILWGTKDTAFRKKEMDRWHNLFSNKKSIGLNNSGHFPQEEAKEEYINEIQQYIKY